MSRLKRVLKWTLIVFALLITVGLLINAYFVWTTDAELAERLEAIRAAGDPVTISDLPTFMETPPERDARRLYDSVEKDVTGIETFIYTQWEEPGVELGELRHSMNPWETPGAGWTTWPPTANDGGEGGLSFDDPIPTLRQASKAEVWSRDLDGSLRMDEWIAESLDADEYHHIRWVARVLLRHMEYCVANGQADEAAIDAIALIRLSEIYGQGRPLIGGLVEIACRGMAFTHLNQVLQHHDVSLETMTALEECLAEDATHDHLAEMLKAERALGITSFERDMAFGKFWLARAFWNGQELGYLDGIEAYIESDDPIQYAAERDLAREQSAGDVSSRMILASLVEPAVIAAVSASARDLTHNRCLRILIAIKRMEQEGRSLEVLDAATLGLPEDVLTDPCCGDPLKIERDGDGWLIYGVGFDRTDDGGRFDEMGDLFEKMRDWGFRP